MENREIYGLTNPQKSIWATEQFFMGTDVNNIAATLTIRQDVDFKILEKAINVFLKNNKSFGLRFKMQDGELIQYFTEMQDIKFEILHLKDKKELKEIATELSKEVFNIKEGNLFKYKLFKLDNGYGGFIIIAHHIISDAGTFSLMGTEIIDNYTKLQKNEDIEIKAYSYEDYIKDEKEYENGSKFIKDKEYWNEVFKDVPEVATIPSVRNKANTDESGKSLREEFALNQKTLSKISEFCKKYKISNFNFFMAVYSIYLSRVSNLKDFVIGTPILNRTNFKEKHTTGMFINTAPLRIKIEENCDFITCAKQIAQSSLSMLRYQKYPYQMLLEDLRKKDSSIPVLFDIMLSYQVTKANDRTLEIPYEVEWLPSNTISDSIYIHLHDNDDNGTLNVAYDYQIEKYSKDDIDNIHKRILHIINQVLNDESCLEKDIDIVTEEEKNKILYEFNNTYTDYPRDKTIVDLFENQVEKTPDNIAVVCGDNQLTYKELNEKANGLANYLVEQGIQKREAIATILDRNIELIICMLAIIKAGGVYLPISTEFPKERIEYIINDSKSKIILTSQNIKLEKEDIKIVNIQNFNYDNYNKNNIKLDINALDILYIIYTSGSTGKPKGVKLSNKNLNNFVHAFTYYFEGINEEDRCLASTNIAFDVSIFEFFITLLNGASLYLYEENSITDIFKYCNNIVKNKITLLYIPPNILNDVYKILSTKDKIKMSKLLIGVEPIKSSVIKKYYKLNPNMKIINAYGPTETTICTTANILNKEDIEEDTIISIGKPICNSKLLILNKNFQISPIGVQGELYVMGDGVGNGYLNNDAKTKSSFVRINNYNLDLVAYKTGDIVKWNHNGNISFIGREDNQVKISGHRIELGEIENCIYQFPNIEKVVANIDNNNKIIAYYIAKEMIKVNDLKIFMKEKLPTYLIPNYFMQLDQFKLTSNGKIDRKALPTPKTENNVIKVNPKNKTEKILKNIYEKILKQDDISTASNFFELGGDSLSAINLSMQIYNKFNIQIGIKDIFNAPTIIELAKKIENSKVFTNENKIYKVDNNIYYPVSSAQRRMYYSASVDGKKSTLYNISGGLKLDKMPDVDRLEECFRKIINENESLRTYFEVEDGDVVQKISNQIEFHIELEKDIKSNIEEIAQKFIKPFDLSKAPLFRVKLVELKNEKSLLLIDMHHIISDGTTIKILTNQISKLYNGQNVENNAIDYKDFAVWENSNLKNGNCKESEDYWLQQFEDKIPILELPLDYVRPAKQSFEGDSIITKLDTKYTNQIYKICKELNVTPFMLFISVYYILLSIYSRTEDIVIGTPIEGRYNSELSNIIGMFVNTLPLRNKIDIKSTFKEFLMQVREQSLRSFEHQDYPLDELIKKLEIKRDSSRNALFDVAFTYQNQSYPTMALKGIETEFYIPKTNISKFDLLLEAIPENENISFRFEYCTQLFSKEYIKMFASYYMRILKDISRNIDLPIAEINILSSKEKEQILKEFNNTTSKYPKEKSIIELFEEQVAKNPNKQALVFEDTKLTYNQLNKKANKLAHYMKEEYNVQYKDVVGILLDKSSECIISILAIIKCGAIFIPIDIEYPKERIEYILDDSNSKIVITTQKYSRLLNDDTQKICIDMENYDKFDTNNPTCNTKSDDLIYIMYTSGSTGRPKGVMITHKSVARLVKNTNYIDFSNEERILQTGSIVFDACTFEIWGALLNGGTLYLIKKENMLNQIYFERYLKENKITSIFLTTALFNQYTEASKTIFEGLRNLLTGGEAVSCKHMKLAQKNFPNLNIVHVYGPTENTTFSTYYNVKEIKNNTVPIGKAIANSTAYVVSKTGQLLPIGVPGELWVGGDGVGAGYLNMEDLTKEKFIDNPFGEGKIYKTGDLVKLLPDGNIEFISRIDNQVKIRGFRIELNEIDNVVKEYPDISKTFTTIKLIDDKKYIITYFTANQKISIGNITLYLQEKLPFYMVPQFLIQLEKFPLTINGKIDVKNLIEPELETLHRYVPAENEIQQQLCDIWSKLFKMKKVSILDNFFELGGDSLTAIKFQTEALKMNININYSDIFEYPTIKSLSEKSQEKQLYRIDETYDYSELKELLSINTIDNIEEQHNIGDCGNILLCGATGFLGAHILDKYLQNSTGTVYCLVRRKENIDSEERLKKILNFYFENKYDEYFRNRIQVVYGDITIDNFGLKANEYKELGSKVETVVNSAALVKHFGDLKMFESINVIGTKNVIKFCKRFNKKLYHISTMSVAGIATPQDNISNDEERIIFNETDFYVGQNLNNAYVYTKFEAEKEILNEVKNGLQGCILRMGNISNRVSDGKFQINVSENAFINRIKAILKIGVVQSKFLDHAIEFTPVDACAEAIIKIIQNNTKFNVLHIFDTKVINFPDIIQILKSLGYNIDTVDDKIFANKIKEFLKDDNLKSQISGLIPDLNKNKTLSLLSKTLPNAYFSTLYLKSIGYEWVEIDKEYIEKYLGYFKKIGYIE